MSDDKENHYAITVPEFPDVKPWPDGQPSRRDPVQAERFDTRFANSIARVLGGSWHDPCCNEPTPEFIKDKYNDR
jgi:hypothetical protein